MTKRKRLHFHIFNIRCEQWEMYVRTKEFKAKVVKPLNWDSLYLRGITVPVAKSVRI